MTTSRSNDVILNSKLISGVEFIQDSLKITSGQPSKVPPTISQSGSQWTITLEAGRSGSSDVAQEFINKSGGPYHIFINPPTVSQPTKPEKLNFFFGVKVSFNQGFPTTNLFLAQGSDGVFNNWWAGGSGLFNSAPGLVTIGFLVSGPNVLLFDYNSSGNNEFFVKTAP